jgi:hypothetical protein
MTALVIIVADSGDTLVGHSFTVEEDIIPDDEVVWRASPRLEQWLEERKLFGCWYLANMLGVVRFV